MSNGPFQKRQATIASLARDISEITHKITSCLASSNCTTPTFASEATGTPLDSDQYEDLRVSLNETARDLLALVNGPKNTLRSLIFSHYDLAALQVALDRRLFDHVPLPSDEPGTISPAAASIAQIAERAGMDKDRTGRIMRLLATHRIFEEVSGESGMFKHTTYSALLAQDSDFNAMAAMQMDDMLKAVSETSSAIRQAPYASGVMSSAFRQRFGVPMYEFYEQHPDKGARFAQAMKSWSQIDRQMSELASSFDWAALGSGKVVDVGGGSGHVSFALAQQFPSLELVVQDISPVMLSQAPEVVGGRVSFQQHDFFQPQPVHDASAFLIRQCLHNFDDENCIRMLRAHVPALERCAPGTPLLINDVVLPDPGTVTKYEERHLRQVDFCMMTVLGAKQRSETEFAHLLKAADDRFEISTIHRNPMGIGLVHAYLRVEEQATTCRIRARL